MQALVASTIIHTINGRRMPSFVMYAKNRLSRFASACASKSHVSRCDEASALIVLHIICRVHDVCSTCGTIADVVRLVSYDLGYSDIHVRQVITQWVKSGRPHLKDRRLHIRMLRNILSHESTNILKLDAI